MIDFLAPVEKEERLVPGPSSGRKKKSKSQEKVMEESSMKKVEPSNSVNQGSKSSEQPEGDPGMLMSFLQ